jgi:hypothetical protein
MTDTATGRVKASFAALVVVALALIGAFAWLTGRDHGAPGPIAAPPAAQHPGSTQPRSEPVPVVESSATPTRRSVPQPEPPEVPDPAESIPGVTGVVLTGPSAPAPGAFVRLAQDVVRTDAAGRFAFESADRPGDAELLVMHEGFEPTTVARVLLRPEVVRGEPLTVVLSGQALTIEGTLVSEAGAPCVGWNLCLWRGAASGIDVFPPMLAEDVAAGANPNPQTRSWVRADPINPNHRRIGELGEFTIGGLRRGGDYVLRAWNEGTLQVVLSPPIPAGTRGYRFVVPVPDVRPMVHGIVQNKLGAPLARVLVRLTMRVFEGSGTTSYHSNHEVVTEADGAFAFSHVPRQDLLLRFTGDGIASLYRELPASEPGQDLVVELATTCSMRLALGPACVADSFTVLDAAGDTLRLTEQRGPGQSSSGTSGRVRAGASPVYWLHDSATIVVLRHGEYEIDRRPIRLWPDRENVVH